MVSLLPAGERVPGGLALGPWCRQARWKTPKLGSRTAACACQSLTEEPEHDLHLPATCACRGSA